MKTTANNSGAAPSGGSAPLRDFGRAVDSAQEQLDQLSDGFAGGAMSPLDMMMFTEAQNLVNRQLELMSRVMKQGHDTAKTIIGNI